MRTCEWRVAVIGLMVACSCQVAAGQSNQEWIALKKKCGIAGNTAYNDWVAAGAKCNSGTATTGVGSGSAEQLGTTLGNIAGDAMLQGFHNLFRSPTPRLAAPLDPAQQQRALAAQQLNNSGIYLLNRRPRDYAGAINEFQKALQQAPGDVVIAENLRYARQLQKESVAAGQTSGLLGNLLGNNEPSTNTTNNSYTGSAPNVFHRVNLDPHVVDFQGMFQNSPPSTARSYLPAANANALNAVLSNAQVVDLNGTEKTTIDPQLLQTQIGSLFAKRVPAAEPPVPNADRPQVQEINNLFSASQTPAGTPGAATKPKAADMKNQTKPRVDDVSSKPTAPPHD